MDPSPLEQEGHKTGGGKKGIVEQPPTGRGGFLGQDSLNALHQSSHGLAVGDAGERPEPLPQDCLGRNRLCAEDAKVSQLGSNSHVLLIFEQHWDAAPAGARPAPSTVFIFIIVFFWALMESEQEGGEGAEPQTALPASSKSSAPPPHTHTHY